MISIVHQQASRLEMIQLQIFSYCVSFKYINKEIRAEVKKCYDLTLFKECVKLLKKKYSFINCKLTNL